MAESRLRQAHILGIGACCWTRRPSPRCWKGRAVSLPVTAALLHTAPAADPLPASSTGCGGPFRACVSPTVNSTRTSCHHPRPAPLPLPSQEEGGLRHRRATLCCAGACTAANKPTQRQIVCAPLRGRHPAVGPRLRVGLEYLPVMRQHACCEAAEAQLATLEGHRGGVQSPVDSGMTTPAFRVSLTTMYVRPSTVTRECAAKHADVRRACH